QFKYTVGHSEILSNDMVDLLIKRELARTTGTMNEGLLEEADLATASLYGTDGEWKHVGVYASSLLLVGRVVNHLF
ncbi:hypothetical protein B0H19DRAFT_914806, partial [Mycena capillaripes]